MYKHKWFRSARTNGSSFWLSYIVVAVYVIVCACPVYFLHFYFTFLFWVLCFFVEIIRCIHTQTHTRAVTLSDKYHCVGQWTLNFVSELASLRDVDFPFSLAMLRLYIWFIFVCLFVCCRLLTQLNINAINNKKAYMRLRINLWWWWWWW